MAERFECSFSDALGPLGTEAPAFIGRCLFADYIPSGQDRYLNGFDGSTVVLVYEYTIGGMMNSRSPTVTYDAANQRYRIQGNGGYFLAVTWS